MNEDNMDDIFYESGMRDLEDLSAQFEPIMIKWQPDQHALLSKRTFDQMVGPGYAVRHVSIKLTQGYVDDQLGMMMLAKKMAMLSPLDIKGHQRNGMCFKHVEKDTGPMSFVSLSSGDAVYFSCVAVTMERAENWDLDITDVNAPAIIAPKGVEYVPLAVEQPIIDFTITPGVEVKIQSNLPPAPTAKSIACECGSEKIDSALHSSWCPKGMEEGIG